MLSSKLEFQQSIFYILDYVIFIQESNIFQKLLHAYLILLETATKKSIKLQMIQLDYDVIADFAKLELQENHKSLVDNGLSQDRNNRFVYVPKQLMKEFTFTNFQWVSLSLTHQNNKSAISNNRKKEFHVQIHEYSANDTNAQYVLKMSSVTAANMKKVLGIPRITSRKHKLQLSHLVIGPLSNFKIIPDDPVRKAKVIKITQLKSSQFHTNNENLDKLLKKYFQIDRLLAVGDVFIIQLPNFNNRKVISSSASFLVSDIEIENSLLASCFDVYSVNSNYTSLYLLGKQENDYHPCCINQLTSNSLNPFLRHPVKQIKQLISEGVDVASTFFSTTTTTTTKFWPHILLYTTSPTYEDLLQICICVANELGLNLLDINAVHFLGDTAAFTEAKLKSLAQQIKENSPCLVILRNIHVSWS